jgi:hypothetical protein
VIGGRLAEFDGTEQRGGSVHDTADEAAGTATAEMDGAGLPALLLSFERIPGESRAEALSHEADLPPVGLKCGRRRIIVQ